jgi:hypothetical protein
LDGAIALKEVRMSSDPRETTALFRYRIVAEATNPRLTPAERGQLVRELASRAYEHPDCSRWTYSRGTLDRWLAPAAITVSMGYCRHRAAISVWSVAIRSYWTSLPVAQRVAGPLGHPDQRDPEGAAWRRLARPQRPPTSAPAGIASRGYRWSATRLWPFRG